MQCLKCGREIPSEQVFCPACLTEMEKYPVKPGTVVNIPRRPSQSPAKKAPGHRYPAVPMEEQVQKLKKRVTVLIFALILALAVIAGLCWLGVKQYFSQENKLLPGQNYSSVTDTGPDTPN